MKAIITVGLGFGDEGKGSVVDYLTRKHDAKLVVRYNGGCQAAHNVVLPDGRHHCFSQFGSGTLAGADTYLGRNVIIDPIGIKTEAKSLYNNFGLKPNIYIHCKALVTTYYHMVMNRMIEASYKHGSCGLGIGQTRKYWLDYGNDAIIAKDLRDIYVLRDKLHLLRQRFLAVQELWGLEAKKYLDQIYEMNLNSYARMLHNTYEKIRFVADLPYNHVNDDTIIFEGAQGVLLDEYYGFHPYTTWSTTTSLHAEEEIDNITSDIEIIGITRSYHTRHGNGPLPTEMYNISQYARKYSDIKDYSFSINHERNNKNEFQGNFRYGIFDLGLFQYALKCQDVHSVFVTCLDDYRKNVYYNKSYGGKFLVPTLQLNNPLKTVTFDNLSLSKTNDILRVISQEVDISHISTGPTFQDKQEYI